MQNTEHSCKKFSGSGMICSAALVLSEFAKRVLQQQALSLPGNHQVNYSLVIHTKQAKWRYIISSRHTGLRSPTPVRNMQSLYTEDRLQDDGIIEEHLSVLYACKSNTVFSVFQAEATAQSLHWLPVTARMKLSSTHQLKRKTTASYKTASAGLLSHIEKASPGKSKLGKKTPRKRKPCSGRVKKGLASQRGAVWIGMTHAVRRA